MGLGDSSFMGTHHPDISPVGALPLLQWWYHVPHDMRKLDRAGTSGVGGRHQAFGAVWHRTFQTEGENILPLTLDNGRSQPQRFALTPQPG